MGRKKIGVRGFRDIIEVEVPEGHKVLKLKTYHEVEVFKEEGYYRIDNPDLNIRIAERSYEEAIRTYEEHIYVLWTQYVETEGPMSVGAKELKSKLQSIVESCQ